MNHEAKRLQSFCQQPVLPKKLRSKKMPWAPWDQSAKTLQMHLASIISEILNQLCSMHYYHVFFLFEANRWLFLCCLHTAVGKFKAMNWQKKPTEELRFVKNLKIRKFPTWFPVWGLDQHVGRQVLNASHRAPNAAVFFVFVVFADPGLFPRNPQSNWMANIGKPLQDVAHNVRNCNPKISFYFNSTSYQQGSG